MRLSLRCSVVCFLCLASFNRVALGECPVRSCPKEDDTWCVQDQLVPNYIFSSRDSRLEVTTRGNQTFSISLSNVKVVVEKRVGAETCANIVGYNPPDLRFSHRLFVFVSSQERKKIFEKQIEKTRKEFENQCFHCVLFDKPGEGPKK